MKQITRKNLKAAVERAIVRAESEAGVLLPEDIEGARSAAAATKLLVVGHCDGPGCLLYQAGRFEGESDWNEDRIEATYALAHELDREIILLSGYADRDTIGLYEVVG